MSSGPRAVVNASPLIFLAKIDGTQHLPPPVVTTPTVLDEVRAGGPDAHPEVDAIEHLLQEDHLLVDAPKDAEASLPVEPHALHTGEATVLALARERGIDEVIVDDRAAIRAAKLLGLQPTSTPFLLLKAARSGDLTPHAFRESLRRLTEHRYHISPELYQRLLEAADAL